MNNNPNQPREFDVVLGGKAPPDIEVQIAALSEALNYDKARLDIVIETLQRRHYS